MTQLELLKALVNGDKITNSDWCKYVYFDGDNLRDSDGDLHSLSDIDSDGKYSIVVTKEDLLKGKVFIWGDNELAVRNQNGKIFNMEEVCGDN